MCFLPAAERKTRDIGDERMAMGDSIGGVSYGRYKINNICGARLWTGTADSCGVERMKDYLIELGVGYREDNERRIDWLFS